MRRCVVVVVCALVPMSAQAYVFDEPVCTRWWSVASEAQQKIWFNCQWLCPEQNDVGVGELRVYCPPTAQLQLIQYSGTGKFSGSEYCIGLYHAPATGWYTFRIRLKGQYTAIYYDYDTQFYLDWENLPEGGGGVPPPPPPPSDPETPEGWWDFITDLFTMSDAKKIEVQTLVNRAKIIGPWGDAVAISTSMKTDPELGPQLFDTKFNYTFLGPRTYAGQGPEGRTVYIWQDLPLPMGDVDFDGNMAVQDASTPWLNKSDTLYGWRDTFRSICGWVLWAVFGVGLICWAKGRVST